DHSRGRAIALELEEPRRRLFFPHPGLTWSQLSPDGLQVTTSSSVNKVWDVSNGKLVTEKAADLGSSGNGVWLRVQKRPVKLIHGKELATLEAPRDNALVDERPLLSPGARRIAVRTGNHTIHLWDLRALRRQLAEIGLDWDLPPYPPAAPTSHGKPLRVEVDLGPLGGAKKD